MKKILEILGKTKEYVSLAIKYLGQLLGIIKKVEEELADQAEDAAEKLEDKTGE